MMKDHAFSQQEGSYVLLVGGKDISRVLYSKKTEEDPQNRIVYEPVKKRKCTVFFQKCKEGEFYCFLIGPLNSVHSRIETQLSSFCFLFCCIIESETKQVMRKMIIYCNKK